MALADEKCWPPQADEPPLPADEVKKLLKEVPDWSRRGKAIERDLKFKDFRQAMEFVNRVADEANSQDHHPDILISYSRVRLTFSTHKIGGLSRNDFIMAAKVDRLTRGILVGA
jgi:4a-hydroxytetrahydrobiopterin dehydratase